MFSDLTIKERDAIDAGLRLYMQHMFAQGYLASGDDRFIKLREAMSEYQRECNPETI